MPCRRISLTDAGKVRVDLRQRFLGAADADAGNVFQRQRLLATEQHMGIVFGDQAGEACRSCLRLSWVGQGEHEGGSAFVRVAHAEAATSGRSEAGR